MAIDVLVAEIGSTTTLVNAFYGMDSGQPRLVGQAFAPTTVIQGDVRIGLEQALQRLSDGLGYRAQWKHFLATSSAAGGLRMTVHGLAWDMTVRAAREAALGAGANLHLVTAGKLSPHETDKIISIRPNIILLAGGVDYGDRATACFNATQIAECLRKADLAIPVIYAGNIENRDEVAEFFHGSRAKLHLIDNIYPRIDQLNVEPARRIIQEVFEANITTAPGMEHLRELVDGHIIPTPGAVMLAAQLLKENIGDLLVFDVGGATTDIHSVTQGSDEIAKYLASPEPEAKRTVEGDLGTFCNRHQVAQTAGIDRMAKRIGINESELESAISGLPPIPATPAEIAVAREISFHCAAIALSRHSGSIKNLFGSFGQSKIAEGKDLTKIKNIVATGGALTRLPDMQETLRAVIRAPPPRRLYPPANAEILIDHDYLMASAGVLARTNPAAALNLMRHSLWLDRQ